MSVELLFALRVYALAAVISMGVAVLIKVIVAVLARPTPVTAVMPVTAPSDAEPPAVHIAIIAAAVHAALGHHRIVHIEDRGHGTAWAAEGRVALRASHDVRHGARHRRG